MGRRGELFSKRQFTKDGRKTYFFNVKENRYGDLYINLAESIKKATGGFQRFSLMIFQEDLDLFVEGFERISDVMLHNGRDSFEVAVGSGKRKYKFLVKDGYKGASEMVLVESVANVAAFNHQSIRIMMDDVKDFITDFNEAKDFLINKNKM